MALAAHNTSRIRIRVERVSDRGPTHSAGFAANAIAKSWNKPAGARVGACIMAIGTLGRHGDVTSLQTPSPEDIYARLYCARGQAENPTAPHKSSAEKRPHLLPLAPGQSDAADTHTAAYWLMLTVRDAIPKTHALTKAEFATIRARLLKIGARIRETTYRVRIAFAAACPEAALFRHTPPSPRDPRPPDPGA